MKNEEYILNEELEIDHKMSFLAQPGTAEVFFYLTRPLLLGEAPPLPRPPLLRRGLQPVNRLFCTRKQALTALIFGCARQSIQASLMLCSRWHESCDYLSAESAHAEEYMRIPYSSR